MANKKYAENLIGNWETSQYEPQRQITKDIYQTNWNKLTNDLNTLNAQLESNFERARQQYSGSLQDTTENSFRNMYNAETNLANRGLASSGLLNNINQANIASVGNAVNKDLGSLLDTNKASIESSISGLNTYGSTINRLAANLADDLGGITDAETKNLQNYYNLVSDLIESASKREASNASSRASIKQQQAEKDLENDLENKYRLLQVLETLDDENLTDNAKRTVLTRELNLTAKQADDAISAKNYRTTSEKLDKQYMSFRNASIPDIRNIRENRVRNTKNELTNYSYKDLYDILNN